MNRNSSFSRRELLADRFDRGCGGSPARARSVERRRLCRQYVGRLLRGAVQPLELHRHRLAVGHRIVRPLGDRRHGTVRPRPARQNLHQSGRPSLRVHGREVPRSGGETEEIPGGGQSRVDRRNLRPAHGHHHRQRIEHPADGRRPGDRPQGARLRLAHVSRRRGVHASADSAVGHAGRLPLRQPGPVGHLGPRRLPRAEPQRLPLARDGRDDDPLRAEERAVRRFGRREPTGRFARSSRSCEPWASRWSFTWEEFGWDNPEQPAYLTAPARYQTLAATGQRRIRHDSRVPSEIRRPGQGDDLPADGRLGQVAHLGTRRRSGARAGSQGGSVAVGRRNLRCGRLRAGAPPRSASSSTRRGETSWPRRATTWGYASPRVGKAT